MTLDLTDEEARALANRLRRAIDRDPYPLAPRLDPLKAILARLEPPTPQPQPLPPFRPGIEARLCFIGHGLIENRCGLIVDARLIRVSGHAERLAALDMVQHVANRPGAITADMRHAAPPSG